MQRVEKQRVTKAEACFNRLRAGGRKRKSVTTIVKRTLHHAEKALEKDLSVFRTISPAKERKDEDDCSISSEIVALDSFEESLRQELEEAEDLWRISERSIEKYASGDEDGSSLEPSLEEDSDEDSNPETSSRPSSAMIDPLLGLAPLSSGTYNSESSSEEENSDNQELKTKSIQDLLSAALLYTGEGGMSLALASDILASQIYAQDSILLSWLHKNLPSYRSVKPWLYGVPVLGSATSNGQLLFLKNDETRGPFDLEENFGEIQENEETTLQ